MQQNNSGDTEVTVQQKPLLLFLITGAIVVSLFLVTVSMWLYNMSGAAQLDLSRPGYQNIRAKAQQTAPFTGFESTGVLDEKALDSFDKLYQRQKAAISKSNDGFGPTPLSNETLGIQVE